MENRRLALLSDVAGETNRIGRLDNAADSLFRYRMHNLTDFTRILAEPDGKL
jgi:hypothetical protein